MAHNRPLLLLIDGHALAYRAFHALAEAGLRSSTGEPTYAVYGFTSAMLNAIEEYQPEYAAVAFDVGKTFRDDLYAEYKANRAETPAEFEQQLERIKQVLAAFDIPIYTAKGYEADDVIGTLARQATERGVDVLILTGDTDTLQLVDDHVTVLLNNPYLRGPKNTTRYGVAEVTERYKGLRPHQLADLRGLKGDPSDNIPGIKGIGEAGAIALLNQFGTIENLYDHLDEAPKRYQKHLEGQRDIALFSKKLATIVCDAPVTLNLAAATLADYDRSRVIAVFQELEFGASLVKRLPPSGSTTVEQPLPSIPQADASAPLQADMFAPEAPAARESSAEPQQLTLFGDTEVVPPPVAHVEAPLHAAPGEYRAACTDADLEAVVAELATAPLVAFDTETRGMNPLRDDLVGLSLATVPGRAWYIPVGHTTGEAQLPRDRVIAALRSFFADPARPKVAHNAKFDIEVLERAGMPVAGLSFDTMLAAGLLDKRRNLKDLAFYELELAEPLDAIGDLIGKGKNQVTFAEVPIARATLYAAADADMTLRLQPALEAKLRAAGGLADMFYRLEMPLVPVLVRMEQAGILLDVPYMRALGERMGRELAQIEQQIFAIAGKPFNINSGDQLSEVLFGPKINLPTTGLERTRTGRYSLTAQALEELQASDATGIIELILRHRRLSKLKSTYVDELPALVNPETGRVHTDYNQLGAATGRLSSNSPNLQNIPTRTEEGREVRRGFIAAPGHVLIAADYSQIELRVLAHITGDPNLIQTFIEGRDIHAATAARLFGVGFNAVDKNQRRIAKTVVFGVIYGISPFGLAQRLGISREQARNLIDSLFDQFPRIRDYIDRTLETGRNEGYVQSLFGRRRPMFDLRTSGPRRQAAEREAINHPIQSTAADIMKLAMIAVDAELRRRRLRTRMLLQVHDELIFEAPEAEVDEVVALVRERMEGVLSDMHPPFAVPLRVEIEKGSNWEELTPV
ncbi:DNA polymerase I [Roseiflexus castenholzii]|uniref:DNA polymerase I n=1 Tax=Roseiflexus castenholzii TaxID=120962 RepID=UPI003C79CA9D